MANPTAQVPMYTVDYDTPTINWPLVSTAQTYYPGEMIGLNASGYANKLDDTAAFKFLGIMNQSPRYQVDSGGSNGDKTLTVKRPKYFSASIASAAITDVGRPVFALYSNEVSFNPGTYKNYVGVVAKYISATQVLIEAAYQEGPNLVAVNAVYSTPADAIYFVAERAYKVISIRGRVTAGASGATATVRKAPSGTAIGSGTALHSSTFDLNGTANANQTLTLSTTDTDLDLAAGDCLAVDVSGTTTGATGVITILLLPVGG